MSETIRDGIITDSMLLEPVTSVVGVGPARAGVLAQAGIETVEDLLLYLPFRYEDRSTVVPVSQVVVGRTCTLKVVIERVRRVGRGRGGRVEATVSDDSGKLRVVWFRQPYVAESLHKDDVVWMFGKVGEHDDKPQLANPVFEKAERDAAADASAAAEGAEPDGGGAVGLHDRHAAGLHIGRLVPIYRRIGPLTQGMLRRIMAAAFERVTFAPESLPAHTRKTLGLVGRYEALRAIHLPPHDADVETYNAGRSTAHQRLVCEEFLAFQTMLQLQRPGIGAGALGEAKRFDLATVDAVLGALPFTLTDGQQAAVEDILADMRSEAPMHRLLQGDVGCGKTAVAGCAMLVAASAGYQAAIMAPTEILARQHAKSLGPWAASQGLDLECLTGSTPVGARRRIMARLADGELRLLVGTHALIEPAVSFANLGLAVIDEQHRFGVRQRTALRDKGATAGRPLPDLLVMTATPIPRTLALTVYGDLDVCTIGDMPPGRPAVVSEVVPAAQWKRVVGMLLDTVARGEQAYVVAPRIEGGDDELAAAVKLEAELRRQLPGVAVGLLHGAQATEEKFAAMQAFVDGETGVLAATTVIEVGVDVPNATLMVVGHAERFGLAQLHQLRGRVGRADKASTCVFVAHRPLSAIAAARLEAISEITDGFVLAEKDLVLRGPGEVLGTRQAGIAGLRVGDPFRDHAWLEATRSEAHRLVAADDAESRAYRERVTSFWQRRFGLLRAG